MANLRTSLNDREFNKFDDSNNVKTSNVDPFGRVAFNSIFGDSIVGNRKPSITAQFQYPLSSRAATIVTENGGSVVVENSMLKIKADAQANSLSSIQSNQYVRYIPGFESFCFFTCVFNEHELDREQEAGVFDEHNGFFLKYNGNGLCYVRRRNGIDEYKVIDIPNVFPKYNPFLGNIYAIRYGYLGFANSSLSVLSPSDGWVLASEYEYANSSVETHIAQTNLPVRGSVKNNTATTSAEMAVGSICAGIVDGSGEEPSARNFSFSQTITVGPGTTYAFTFRNKTIYGGIDNRISGMLSLISTATEGVKPVKFAFRRNMTITNPATATWTDIDTLDSIHEYSTNATVTPGSGSEMISWGLSKSDSLFRDVTSQKIDLRPGETATFLISTPSNSDIEISLRWFELF